MDSGIYVKGMYAGVMVFSIIFKTDLGPRYHLLTDTIIPGNHAHGQQLVAQPICKGPILGLPGTGPFGHQLLHRRVLRFVIKIEYIRRRY